MKAIHLIILALLAGSAAHARCASAAAQRAAQAPETLHAARQHAAPVVIAQDSAGEEAHQVPVVEGVERPDSPSVDAAQGNADADAPAAQPPSSDVAPPPAEQAPAVVQPPVQQD